MNKGELAFLFVIAVITLLGWLKYQRGNRNYPIGYMLRLNSTNIRKIIDRYNHFRIEWTEGSFAYYAELNDALQPVIVVADHRTQRYVDLECTRLTPERISICISGVTWDIVSQRCGRGCSLVYIRSRNL